MKAIHARVFMTVLALLLLSSCGDGGTAVVSDSGGTVSNPAYDDSAGQAAPVIQVTEPEEGTEIVMLSIDMVTAFTVTNAEGEALYWDNDQLTGTMAVYSDDWSISDPAEMMLTVPWSDSFRFVPESTGADNCFRVFGSGLTVRTGGENIAEVFVEPSGGVTLSGSGMDFSVAYKIGNDPVYTVSGSGADCVAVAGESGGGWSVTGLVGECTIKGDGLEQSAFDAGTGNTVYISTEGEVTVVPGESA